MCLCEQQIGHLVASVATSALISGSPCHWACSQPSSLPPRCQHWEDQEPVPLEAQCLSRGECSAVNTTGHESLLTLCLLFPYAQPHASSRPCPSSASRLPSRILKPDKPLVTARGSVSIPILAYFSFHPKWTTRCSAQNSAHWEVFPSLLFEDHPGLRLETAAPIFGLHIRIRPTRP